MISGAYKTEHIEDVGGLPYEYELMEPTEQALLGLIKDLFEIHWSEIVFGTCIQGAAFEIRAMAPPKKI